MTLEAALHGHLASDSLISPLVGDRVYPMLLPQSAAMPALTFQRIDTAHDHMSHDERSMSSLVKPRFQIDCYAADDPGGTYAGYDKAQEVATAVRKALRGYSGLLGGVQAVSGGEVFNQHDDYDPETQRYRAIVDVRFNTAED